MGDIAEEVLAGVENEVNKVLNSNQSEKGIDDGADNQFKMFDNSFTEDNPSHGHIDSNFVCKKILFISICQGTGMRAWDVLLLLPALFFLVFLGIRWSSTKRKLLATHSMMFRTFHFLVGSNVALALTRSLISMILHSVAEPDKAQVLDKTLWIILQSYMLFTEICVLVFGLCGSNDSLRSMKKVIVFSVLMSLAFSVSLSVFEFSEADTSFEVFYNSRKYFIYGYGGASFYFTMSIMLSIAYATTLLCALVPNIRNRLIIPDKPPFYQYCGLLMATHCLMATGAGMIYFNGNPNGLCLLNFASFLYVAFFAPLTFIVFLNPLFHSNQPTLMFTYKAQLDDIDEEDEDRMNNARGSLQFSLTNTQDIVQDDSHPIVLNGASSSSGVLIEGLASPDSVTEDPLGSSVTKY